jgi:hypothetical protein
VRRNLDLRNPNDRVELENILPSAGIKIDRPAMDYLLAELSEDWLKLNAFDSCSLTTGKGHSGIGLAQWGKLIQCLYEFREHAGIQEQLRRLCLSSHEKLDTALVISVACRYRQLGYEVRFEPNGHGSSDLFIARQPDRLYLEIKRENPQEHQRQQRIQSVAALICSGVREELKDWLSQNDARIEVMFSKLFSDDHSRRVVREIVEKSKRAVLGTEDQLECLRGSSMILLPRESDAFYEKGSHHALITIEKAGTPVELSLKNMPVRCTFENRANLQALGERLRKAGRQLGRDLNGDLSANGFIVLETVLGGQEACAAIEKRFWSRLPDRCWGVTLISHPGFVIPRSDLTQAQIEIMKASAVG